MTGAGMVLGTPEYMAPELIMGEPFDGRVDQYALAITVYEMLCGRRPFEDGTKTKVLVLHTSKPPPALTEWCAALPDRLSQTVLKGLNKDPNDRYPRCIDLARAVAAAAEGVVARDDRIRLKCPGAARQARCPRPTSPGSKRRARPRHVPRMQVAHRHFESRFAWHPESRPVARCSSRSPGNPGEYAATSGRGLPAGGTTASHAPGRLGGHAVAPPRRPSRRHDGPVGTEPRNKPLRAEQAPSAPARVGNTD